MDESLRGALLNIVDALEHYWLRNNAASYLLDKHHVPHWQEAIDEYCERESSQNSARQRFAPARALLQQSQKESEAAEVLLAMIPGPDKPN